MTNADTHTDTFPPLPPEGTTSQQLAGLVEAEARLLAICMARLQLLDPLRSMLQPQHFSAPLHGRVWAELISARKAGHLELDVFALHLRLEPHDGLLEELVRIEHYSPSTPSTAEKVRSLATAVIEKAREREEKAALLAVSALAFSDRPSAQCVEEALKRLKSVAATVTPQHPFIQTDDWEEAPPAVKWIIPGVIQNDVVTISGARGVGKTTAILPLAMVAAGLHHPDDPLAPIYWRHVIYISEDTDQCKRIVSGMVEKGGLGIKWADVKERVHLVKAKRLDPAYVVEVGALYIERFTREVDGFTILPLVVFDTKSAVLDFENENDNSEASRAVALLRQDFCGLPAWVIGHIAKSQFGRTDVAALSDRGAGSFESDVTQCLYLVEEGGQRFLLLGKRRFETDYLELKVESHVATVEARTEWGGVEMTKLRWGIVTPPNMSRSEAREQAKEAEERERRGDLREAILNAVQVAHQAGNPLAKTGVRAVVRGFKKDAILIEVEALLSEGWLHAVDVPKGQRANNNKTSFLVRLSTEEHESFMRSGYVPEAKKVIPQSWLKS